MATRQLARQLSVFALLSGVVYACSDTVNVTQDPGGLASGGKATGGTGGSSAASGQATGGSGNVISVGKGGNGGQGSGKGGNGSSARGGSSGTSDLGQSGFDDGSGFGGFPDVTFDYEPDDQGQAGACASETGQATLVKRPMDVIVSIDNSESMSGEIQEVQKRINADFAGILAASGIDYRVILVSRYGNVFVHNQDGGGSSDSAYSVCIGAPLSSIACPASSGAATPVIANTPPRFYHHSTDIGSNNLWCRLLSSYTTSDPISTHGRAGWVPVAPNGWKAFVRQEAYKVFIAITDDKPTVSGSTGCPGLDNNPAGATAFDTALRALDPLQFQTPAGERNYKWYSIVGMHADMADAVLTPDDPVETRCCRASGTPQTACQGTQGNQLSDAAFAGEGYQQLSIMTGALRYPSCYTANFNGIFNAIAEGVIEGAKASCDYEVPEPSHGIVDFNQTKVAYKPGTGASVPLPQHASAAACSTNEGFYYSDDHKQIHLCPATCTIVQADPAAKVSIDFGCLGS